MKKKYYKVVKEFGTGTDKVYRSLTKMSDRPDIVYPVGEWVYAPGNTRLFLYDEQTAKSPFFSLRPNETLWECEVTPGILRGRGVWANEQEFWDKVEKNLKSKKKWDHGIPAAHGRTPIHAYLVKGVKLLKEIK